MITRTSRCAALVAAFAFAAAALGAPALTAPASSASHDISIVDTGFEPAALTVLTGEPVSWTNNGARTHTVTSDGGSEFDSGDLAPGEGYGHVFESPGTYPYHCAIHPQLKGTITVKAAPATATPSGSPEPTPPAGTLPPDFSPFPSVGPDATPTPEPTATPQPSATPIPADTGDGSRSSLLLVAVGSAIVGLVVALWWRRRRTV